MCYSSIVYKTINVRKPTRLQLMRVICSKEEKNKVFFFLSNRVRSVRVDYVHTIWHVPLIFTAAQTATLRFFLLLYLFGPGLVYIEPKKSLGGQLIFFVSLSLSFVFQYCPRCRWFGDLVTSCCWKPIGLSLTACVSHSGPDYSIMFHLVASLNFVKKN